MSFIIGVSGTHGTGKSTLLHDAEEAGIEIYKSQISRSVQKKLGWDSLDRIQDSEDNLWDFQFAVLEALVERDREINALGVLTLAERTPADLWAYTKIWCSKMGIDPVRNPTARDYYIECKSAACKYNSFILVKMHDDIPFEQDPHRAKLDTRKNAENFITEFTGGTFVPTFILDMSDRQERLSRVLDIISLKTSMKKD